MERQIRSGKLSGGPILDKEKKLNDAQKRIMSRENMTCLNLQGSTISRTSTRRNKADTVTLYTVNLVQFFSCIFQFHNMNLLVAYTNEIYKIHV